MSAPERSTASRILIAFAVAVCFAASAWTGIALTSGFGRIALIWLANGIVVSVLLAHHEDRVLWYAVLTSGFAANVGLNIALGYAAIHVVGGALSNCLEVCIAAYALRGRLTVSSDLLQFKVVLRFFVVALLAAPVAGALLAASIINIDKGTPILEVIKLWIPADALGMGIMVPLMLALRPRELLLMARREPWYQLLIPYVILLTVTLGVFTQSRYPLLFLLLPPILLVVFRMGFNGAALAIFMVAAVAITTTLGGSGPFMLVSQSTMVERVFAMQLLFGSLILTTYPVCAMLATQQTLIADVTALNEHRRLATSAANAGFYIWDLTTNHLEWDAQLYQMFDIDPQFGSITHEAWRARIHPLDLERVEHSLHELLTDAKDVEIDFRILWPDGTERDIRSRGVIQRDELGAARKVVGLSMDITEIRRLDRMKSEFVSIVSHELRTPLTSIRGALGLLADARISSTKALQLTQLASRNAERLAILIDDILDMEKIESGKMTFDLRNHSLAELMEQAVQANSAYAEHHKVHIQLRNEMPDMQVRVDANRLLQIMANLLSNAAKFSPTGASIDVSVVRQHRGVRISVRDYGAGIAPKFQDKIFGKFCQGDCSDSRQKGGSGLGLAISKALTERMSGTISFITSAEAGTTFFLDLPSTHTDANSDAEREPVALTMALDTHRQGAVAHSGQVCQIETAGR